MTDGYFNNRGNSINIITNDRCGIEDYTEWENEAEFILLKNYCIYNIRYKEKYSLDEYAVGAEYLRSFSERNNAWQLLFEFRKADKDGRLAMKDEIDKVGEMVYSYSRSQIVRKENQSTDI